MQPNKPVNNHYERYLENGGEMGSLTRSYDWSLTNLGDPNTWTPNLLTTLSIILHSKHPKILWWGNDLIQFYNDAYRPSLGQSGKHPTAFGQKAEDCWPEIWPVIKPLIDQVMNGGESFLNKDQLIPIIRNNRLEEVYWTFCYSRVIDFDGSIGGVLVTCTETTNEVLQQKKIIETLHDLKESEQRLANLIVQAPIGIGVLKSKKLIIETANSTIIKFWGKSNEVIGKPLDEALPELEGQPFLKILDDVFTSGNIYANNQVFALLENNGILRNYYFDIIYQPIKSKSGITESILVLATDVTEQVNARQFVEESSLQFRQMADSIIQMVWVTDKNGSHEYFNQRWYDFTGSDFESSKGQGWEYLFHPEDREMAKNKWALSLKSGQPYEVEYRLKNKIGEYIWVLGRAAPFFNKDGDIIKWFGTCTDINEQKLILEQKDEFISIASHELKTPITTLKGVIQLLDRLLKEQSPKTISLIELGNKSIDKVASLIDNLLNASKFNHGMLYLDKHEFVLANLVRESTDHINLEGKYAVNINGDLNLKIFADAEKIGQVIINFISNAIKYASESPKIDIDIEDLSDFVKISVNDYGNGILPERMPHLFDRYYRVESSAHNTPGLGLGLYICSEIIKKHGGEIGAESKIGQGSSFWFKLPIYKPE